MSLGRTFIYLSWPIKCKQFQVKYTIFKEWKYSILNVLCKAGIITNDTKYKCLLCQHLSHFVKQIWYEEKHRIHLTYVKNTLCSVEQQPLSARTIRRNAQSVLLPKLKQMRSVQLFYSVWQVTVCLISSWVISKCTTRSYSTWFSFTVHESVYCVGISSVYHSVDSTRSHNARLCLTIQFTTWCPSVWRSLTLYDSVSLWTSWLVLTFDDFVIVLSVRTVVVVLTINPISQYVACPNSLWWCWVVKSWQNIVSTIYRAFDDVVSCLVSICNINQLCSSAWRRPRFCFSFPSASD